MPTELVIAIIGLLTAVVGVVAAYLQRRKEVVHRYEEEADGRQSPPDQASEVEQVDHVHALYDYCLECGAEASHWRETYCKACGSKLLARDDRVSARFMTCGHLVPFFAKYCGICGKRARSSEPGGASDRRGL